MKWVGKNQSWMLLLTFAACVFVAGADWCYFQTEDCDINTCARFRILENHTLYALREYEAGEWVGATLNYSTKRFPFKDFQERFFNYLRGYNDREVRVQMESPLLIRISNSLDKPETTVFHYLPLKDNPKPSDPGLIMMKLPVMKVYTKCLRLRKPYRVHLNDVKADAVAKEGLKVLKRAVGANNYDDRYHYFAVNDYFSRPFHEVWLKAKTKEN